MVLCCGYVSKGMPERGAASWEGKRGERVIKCTHITAK